MSSYSWFLIHQFPNFQLGVSWRNDPILLKSRGFRCRKSSLSFPIGAVYPVPQHLVPLRLAWTYRCAMLLLLRESSGESGVSDAVGSRSCSHPPRDKEKLQEVQFITNVNPGLINHGLLIRGALLQ